jgi:putative transposase
LSTNSVRQHLAEFAKSTENDAKLIINMGSRHTAFAVDEWYHCYTRSIEGRTVFETESDYQRFMQALYLCNDVKSLRRDDLPRKHGDLFTLKRNEPLVEIGAYSLMPNHFHLLLHETHENGISRFMQKIGTAYTMYFNIKHQRIGGLFIRPFRAKHIGNDVYFKQVAQYIHLNAAELFEPGWKRGHVASMTQLEYALRSYQYSSYQDYLGVDRPEKEIISKATLEGMYDDLPNIEETIENACAYYGELRY